MTPANWPDVHEVRVDGVLDSGWDEWSGDTHDAENGQTVIVATTTAL